MTKICSGGGCFLNTSKAPSRKKQNFIYRDIREFNIILLLLIGIFIISLSGYCSYALFSYEATSPFTITVKAGKLIYSSPAYCFAYEAEEETMTATITDYYCYEGNEYGYETITDLAIPEEIDGYTVISIGKDTASSSFDFSLFINSRLACEITSVIIPDSITTIGTAAFSSCKLTNIDIPNSVTKIGVKAFQYNNLGSIVLPDSVQVIGDYAFEKTNLTSVTFGNGVTSIGSWAFQYNNLTNVDIPDSVQTIGGYAFGYNNLVGGLVIPDSVISIEGNAFRYNNLNYVIIGENSQLTEETGIGGMAFMSSNATKIATLSDGLTKTYLENPNLTTIYNNSGKKFKWLEVIQGRYNVLLEKNNFEVGTVNSYADSNGTIYNSVVVTKGYPE